MDSSGHSSPGPQPSASWLHSGMPRLCEVGGAYNTTTTGGLARPAVLKPARRGEYEETHSASHGACCNYVDRPAGSRYACLRNADCRSQWDRAPRSRGDCDRRSQRRRSNPSAAEGGRGSCPIAHADIHRNSNRRSCGHTGAPAPTAAPTASPTAVPVPTPTPTAVPTPEARPTPRLSFQQSPPLEPPGPASPGNGTG